MQFYRFRGGLPTTTSEPPEPESESEIPIDELAILDMFPSRTPIPTAMPVIVSEEISQPAAETGLEGETVLGVEV